MTLPEDGGIFTSEDGIDPTILSPTPPWDDTENPTGQENVPAAIVTIGQVDLNEDNDAFFTNITPDVIFSDYRMKNRYEKDKHIYMLPISSPEPFQGASVAFVQIASPTLLWVADWTAAKLGEQPAIPDANAPPLQDDWVLLDEVYEPVMIILRGGGKVPLYRINGTFIYGHKNPQTATINNLSFGAAPWLLDNLPTGRGVPASTLTPNLINSPDVSNGINNG